MTRGHSTAGTRRQSRRARARPRAVAERASRSRSMLAASTGLVAQAHTRARVSSAGCVRSCCAAAHRPPPRQSCASGPPAAGSLAAGPPKGRCLRSASRGGPPRSRARSRRQMGLGSRPPRGRTSEDARAARALAAEPLETEQVVAAPQLRLHTVRLLPILTTRLPVALARVEHCERRRPEASRELAATLEPLRRLGRPRLE
eukprot:5779167-Prymnesium_polylepis.1